MSWKELTGGMKNIDFNYWKLDKQQIKGANSAECYYLSPLHLKAF